MTSVIIKDGDLDGLDISELDDLANILLIVTGTLAEPFGLESLKECIKYEINALSPSNTGRL